MELNCPMLSIFDCNVGLSMLRYVFDRFSYIYSNINYINKNCGMRLGFTHNSSIFITTNDQSPVNVPFMLRHCQKIVAIHEPSFSVTLWSALIKTRRHFSSVQLQSSGTLNNIEPAV